MVESRTRKTLVLHFNTNKMRMWKEDTSSIEEKMFESVSHIYK